MIKEDEVNHFKGHLSEKELQVGFKTKTFVQGVLRVSRYGSTMLSHFAFLLSFSILDYRASAMP